MYIYPCVVNGVGRCGTRRRGEGAVLKCVPDLVCIFASNTAPAFN